jgi:hypothetical protein
VLDHYICSWSIAAGTGLGGRARFLNLIFPLAAYCLNISWRDYKENIILLKNDVVGAYAKWIRPAPG